MTFIYLASTSPRRRDLLTQFGQPFQPLSVQVDEQVRAGEAPQDYVERLAREKAQAGVKVATDDSPVLGADTIVVLAQQILQKPVDAAEAGIMLRALAGRCHLVMTAIAFADSRHILSQIVTTEVCFRPLTATEITDYIATGEPLDKAGAYAIQGCGGGFVRSVCGSYHNVVGLPLAEMAELLVQFTVLRQQSDLRSNNGVGIID